MTTDPTPAREWTGHEGHYLMRDSAHSEVVAIVHRADDLSTILNALARADEAAALRAERARFSVERLARAAFGSVPPNKHGQLCPVWTTRKWGQKRAEPWDACDCWVKPEEQERAAAILAALDAEP